MFCQSPRHSVGCSRGPFWCVRVVHRKGTQNVQKRVKAEQNSYNREHPVAFSQKREKVGVGQSDMAKNTLCRYCFQVNPLLARKAPGAPGFSHCPSNLTPEGDERSHYFPSKLICFSHGVFLCLYVSCFSLNTFVLLIRNFAKQVREAKIIFSQGWERLERAPDA